MPIPKPQADEGESDFIGRCMGDDKMNEEYPDNDQRHAACRTIWSNRDKHHDLLRSIKARGGQLAEFGYGITTADRYIGSIEHCIGPAACAKYANARKQTGWKSFHDIKAIASRTLVYSNPDMVVEDIYSELSVSPTSYAHAKNIIGTLELKHGAKQSAALSKLELPKNTLMVFRHCLTSSRRDRDRDILRTKGAQLDPKMLMLWQHMPTLPIGKMLAVADHTDDRLSVYSAIVDMNELSHDAAVMVDNKMGRYSHGFNALEFDEIKDAQSGGYDIKLFEIMEESLVSIPSNVDAETEDVLLSLVDGNKLKSDIMKEIGGKIKSLRPKRIVSGWENSDATKTEQPEEHKCRCGASKETDEDGTKDTGPEETKGAQVKGRAEVNVWVGNACTTVVISDDGELPDAETEKVRSRLLVKSKTLESKHFDVDLEYLEASKLEYEWASRWLSCQIKDMHVLHTHVPRFRMGSVLTGAQNAQAGWRLHDTRNITSKGKENPPTYDLIQLNSKTSNTFLVDGIQFWKTDKNEAVCFKYTENWNGVIITTYATTDTPNKTLDAAYEWAKVNNFLKGEAFSLTGDFIPRSEIDFDDLFLEVVNEKAVKTALRLINDKQSKMVNRGMIFAGPPGTGKTLSGKILMNKANAAFIWVSARDFWTMGATAALCAGFDLARELAPAVLFFEDVDNWISSYGIDILKTEMDGIARSTGVLTILTTNFPERLPDALIDRPGRFHDVLTFNLPSNSIRQAMLKKWVDGIDDATLNSMVEKTDGFSGAHIYELVYFAKTLQEEEEIDMAKSLELAVDKITQQRETIDATQLAGSNYRHRGNKPMYAKVFDGVGGWKMVPVVGTITARTGRIQYTKGNLSKANEDRLKEARENIAEAATMEIPRGAKAMLRGAVKDIDSVFNSLTPSRSMSKANEKKLRDAKEGVDEAGTMDGVTKPCRALIRDASDDLDSVLKSFGEVPDDVEEEKNRFTVNDAMALVLKSATTIERRRLAALLRTMEEEDERSRLTSEFEGLQ